MGSHHEYFFLLTIAAVFFSSARFCSSFSSYRHIATTATNIKKFAMSQPSASTSSWNVESGVDPLLISQSQFMESDTVLVLDNNDNVISSASKRPPTNSPPHNRMASSIAHSPSFYLTSPQMNCYCKNAPLQRSHSPMCGRIRAAVIRCMGCIRRNQNVMGGEKWGM